MYCRRREFVLASVSGILETQLPSTPSKPRSVSANVRDFGAVGDGITDDRAAIAAAVRANRGRRVEIPEGNYCINADAGPIILEEVELIGEGVLDGDTTSIDRGTNLWISGQRNSPFKVRRGTSISGLGIYYPHQIDGQLPQVYPCTFSFDFSSGPVQFVKIERVVAYNTWRFIDVDDEQGRIGHVEIIGNYICALNRGIYVRRNLEHLRIERNNFTFGHWLESTEAGARAYIRANATAIQVDESDRLEVVDNLFFGHLRGLFSSRAGLCQFMKIVENKFDQVRYGVNALGSGRFDGQVIGNTFNSFDTGD